MLRANGKIKAEYVDEKTGEARPYSESSIIRALTNAKLHPDQLMHPPPAVRLRSLHPNHVWQIDPSLCVLYYLSEGKNNGNGLNVMEAAEFYKNKPNNVKKIESERVWRYVITDHTSGAIYVEYVYGGETSENLCNTFINAMQRKERLGIPFCGVPKLIMLDPGSANTSKMFDHLCYQLGVKKQVNQAGNPRAKGQVEKANDIVERHFESRLRFHSVANLAELNALAVKWTRHFNRKHIHSRHKMSRYDAWLKIQPDQLVFPPSVALCRELMISELSERTVNAQFEISFGGQTYKVDAIPNINVGEKIRVGKNPYRPECVQVECFEQVVNTEGEMIVKPYWFVIEPMQTDRFAFDVDAPVIGESFSSFAKTETEKHRETVENLAYGVENEDALKKAKKANLVLFNGEIDPFKTISDKAEVLYVPKKGQEHELTANARRVEQKPVGLVECAKQLKAKFPHWSGKHYQHLAKHFAEGVPVDMLEQWLQGEGLPEILNPEPKIIQLKVA